MTPVSEIKLIRTDTTLDLSQKAEKVCFFWIRIFVKYVKFVSHFMGSTSSKTTRDKLNLINVKQTPIFASEKVAPFCDPSGDNDWLNSYKGLLQSSTACWGYASFEYGVTIGASAKAGASRVFKRRETGQAGNRAAKIVPPCTAKRSQTWMFVLKTE